MSKWLRKPSLNIPFEANQHVISDTVTPGVQYDDKGDAFVRTIQGRDVPISIGEWAIQEPDGEHYYPCSDEIFRARYDPYEEAVSG